MSQRDYKAEYARRQQRARERGFGSYAQQRRFSPKIRSPRDLARLPENARSARTDALHVLGLAREQRIPIEQAAREAHVPIDVVRWWAGDALKPTRAGKTTPQRGDRMLRLRPVFLKDGGGVEFVETRGSNAAKRAQRIFDVQYRFIQGDASETELARIAGQKVAGQTIESDPGRLEAIAEVGGADIADAYREVIG